MKIATIARTPGCPMSGGSVAFTTDHAVPAARKQRAWLPGNAALYVITDVQSMSASSDERSP
jgi:hypothetical protein